MNRLDPRHNVDAVEGYQYLIVNTDNRLKHNPNTETVYKKGKRRLYCTSQTANSFRFPYCEISEIILWY